MIRKIAYIVFTILITASSQASQDDLASAKNNIRQVADGFYESVVVRDGTPIYFYHQEIKTDEDRNFWLSFTSSQSNMGDDRGLHLIYRFLLEQDNPECEFKYDQSTYDFMKKIGVNEPEKRLAMYQEYWKKKGMRTAGLEKLLRGHRGGLAGFDPYKKYIVFACRQLIEQAYRLSTDQAANVRNENPKDLAKFSNILLCYNSFYFRNGGIEHRGIFKPLDELMLPDPKYKNLAIPAHAFGAEVERTFLKCQYLVIRPLAFMLILLAKEFPGGILHGDAMAQFLKTLNESNLDKYPQILKDAFEFQKTQKPLDLEALKDATCEQSCIVIDLGLVADRFFGK